MGNPDPLFNWPFARVLSVYFLDGFGRMGERVMTDTELREWVERKRRERGE